MSKIYSEQCHVECLVCTNTIDFNTVINSFEHYFNNFCLQKGGRQTWIMNIVVKNMYICICCAYLFCLVGLLSTIYLRKSWNIGPFFGFGLFTPFNSILGRVVNYIFYLSVCWPDTYIIYIKHGLKLISYAYFLLVPSSQNFIFECWIQSF